MTSTERVLAVLEGRKPDRPPCSFWYHFPPDQVWGEAAVEAHVRHFQKYHLDFLKVMNDNGYPHEKPIRRIEDLRSVRPLRGDEPEFARQLDLISGLRARLGEDALMATTIFNAWAVLRHLIQPPPREHRPPDLDAGADDAPSEWIRTQFAREPAAITRALDTIAASLGRFAARCLEAGADGIFLSVRDDWVDVPPGADLYRRIVRKTDLQILGGAAQARFNLLHVCGRAVNFRAFAEYPVAAINWADRAAGPSIREVAGWLQPAICAGVDNLGTLVNGSPQDVAGEVRDALQQAGDRPIILAPGCTFDPHRVAEENLRAIR